MTTNTGTSNQKLNLLRKALAVYDKALEAEGLEVLSFKNNAQERGALVNWMLQTEFDIWVEVGLGYEHTKNLSVVEKQRLLKKILNRTMNMLDRVFYGHRTERKNERGTRFTYKHLGNSGINDHAHMLVQSDKRVGFSTYCGLLENILKHMFIETTESCTAKRLDKSREHAARYVTHEYDKLKNETLNLETTNIGKNNTTYEFNDDIKRRIGRLKMKILRKALSKQTRQIKAEEAVLGKHAI